MNPANSPPRIASALLLAVIATTIGCANRGIFNVDCCADIPPGAIPEPAGAKICNWHTSHVSAALADQASFYRADFVGQSAALGPAALRRLTRNLRNGLLTDQTLTIEPSGDPDLDSARVVTVQDQIADSGDDPGSYPIQIGYPPALGLEAEQAEQIAGTGRGRQSPGPVRSFGNTFGRAFTGFGGIF